MNFATTTFAALGLAATLAASAQAAPRGAFATDVDYLRASRCRGIAEGVGADGATLAAFVNSQGLGRAEYILQRGEDERTKARRQAKGYGRANLEAELAGACAAYGAGAAVAHAAAQPKG